MLVFLLTNQWKGYTSVSEINDSDIFPSNSNILPKKDFTHKLEGLSMLCFFWNVFGSLIPLIPTKLTQRGRQEYGAGITNIASPQNEVIRLCLCRTGPVFGMSSLVAFQSQQNLYLDAVAWSYCLSYCCKQIVAVSRWFAGCWPMVGRLADGGLDHPMGGARCFYEKNIIMIIISWPKRSPFTMSWY